MSFPQRRSPFVAKPLKTDAPAPPSGFKVAFARNSNVVITPTTAPNK